MRHMRHKRHKNYFRLIQNMTIFTSFCYLKAADCQSIYKVVHLDNVMKNTKVIDMTLPREHKDCEEVAWVKMLNKRVNIIRATTNDVEVFVKEVRKDGYVISNMNIFLKIYWDKKVKL